MAIVNCKGLVSPTTEARRLETRLEAIAAQIAAGANPQAFQDELDELLGTSMVERDEVAEGVWESSYRTREEEP
jgi:hypothetical protein